MKNALLKLRMVLAAVVTVASLTATAHAAAPGITGPAFNLTAAPAYLTQPDGQAVYSWGYGCTATAPPAGFAPTLNTSAFCNTMQVPGPTLIVTEGVSVSVTLTNNLPASAGNTSILFPGFNVTATAASSQPTTCVGPALAAPATAGLLTTEAANGCAVTYTFTASTPGTHSYYSGTQSDLQVEMGMYGAVIVLPANPVSGSACKGDLQSTNDLARGAWSEPIQRLSTSAYDNAQTCYDREYLFQFAEMDPNIHTQAESQVAACTAAALAAATANTTPGQCTLQVPTEPYHPAYFLINGRSMPDDMDANYTSAYPHQPYNGNPHLHPGEQVLLRIIGQGRWQHPFHEHANHVRILARDGNLILTPDGGALAGPALFTTTTTPGVAMDGIFYYTGRGLNWDMYGHNPASGDTNATLPCTPDANGYNTDGSKAATPYNAYQAINYYEWCADHNKPLQSTPIGDVAAGGPMTLPDPNILTNGAWYGGSPYLGPDATKRAVGKTGTTPPAGTVANPPSTEAGFAFMWHSHNEREITTNNAFPGGMMMMMLVDSREFVIDETN